MEAPPYTASTGCWTGLDLPAAGAGGVLVVVSAGVAHLSGEGATTDPARAVARSGAAWSALGAAGIAARVRLVKRLWLGAELDGIATVPPLYIRVADAKPSSRFGVLANVGYKSVSSLVLLAAVAACSPRTLALVELLSDAGLAPPSIDANLPDASDDASDDAGPATLRRGLVGLWHLDDGVGSTVALDSSGNGNHGTLVGLDPALAWVPDARAGLSTPVVPGMCWSPIPPASTGSPPRLRSLPGSTSMG